MQAYRSAAPRRGWEWLKRAWKNASLFMGRKLDAMFERMSTARRLARRIQAKGGLKMKFIRIAMALAAAGTIASTSALLADSPVTPV
jgi:hypothetical protein